MAVSRPLTGYIGKAAGKCQRPLFVEKPGCAIQEATGFLAYSE